MSITIENPTAEAALEALQKLPLSEMERLKTLLNAGHAESPAEEEEAWRAISAHGAARFFEEEEKG